MTPHEPAVRIAAIVGTLNAALVLMVGLDVLDGVTQTLISTFLAEVLSLWGGILISARVSPALPGTVVPFVTRSGQLVRREPPRERAA